MNAISWFDNLEEITVQAKEAMLEARFCDASLIRIFAQVDASNIHQWAIVVNTSS
jgi:hypothetical protein